MLFYKCLTFSRRSEHSLLASSISTLKQSQEDNAKTLTGLNQKLLKLEKDVAATKDHHEDTTEHAIKRTRRGQPLEFNRVGHEEQFYFNLEVQDNNASASRQLDRLETSEKDKAIIQKVKEELQEGAASLLDRQKMIRLADTSENGWGAVAEYKGNDFADNKEDNKKMLNSDHSTGAKKRRLAASQRGSRKRSRQAAAVNYSQPTPPG